MSGSRLFLEGRAEDCTLPPSMHRHTCMCTHARTHMHTHAHVHMHTHARTCTPRMRLEVERRGTEEDGRMEPRHRVKQLGWGRRCMGTEGMWWSLSLLTRYLFPPYECRFALADPHVDVGAVEFPGGEMCVASGMGPSRPVGGPQRCLPSAAGRASARGLESHQPESGWKRAAALQ